MSTAKKYGVYKVLRKTERASYRSPIYTSAFVRGSAALSFQIKQQTTSDTPIFVYLDYRYAVFSASVSSDLIIVRGATTTEPFPIVEKSPMILSVADYLSQKVIADFWKMPRDVMDVFDARPATGDMYGVYDFTPLHITS